MDVVTHLPGSLTGVETSSSSIVAGVLPLLSISPLLLSSISVVDDDGSSEGVGGTRRGRGRAGAAGGIIMIC